MDSKKPNYIFRLLIICVTCLALLMMLITFADNRYIPTWTDIGRAIFGDETKASDEDTVRFIDVGQGDSILISSNGYNALIDFGDESDHGSELLDALRSYKIERLDCIILSHYDMDHVGGAPKILKALDVEYALLPELSDKEANDFDDFQYALENSGAEVSIARVGTLVNIGDFDITVIGHYADESDSNDRSVVLMAECGGKKFLLTGDAGADIENRLMEEGTKPLTFGDSWECSQDYQFVNENGNVINAQNHELTHAILFAMGKNELNDDESFVNTFASFLSEAISTMEE